MSRRPSGLIAESYRQDLRLRRGTVAHLGAAAVVAVAVVLPFRLSTQWQSVAVFALIAAISALGLHVLTGLAGQVSLGHSAFVGIGAYTAIWCGADRGWPIVVWLPASGLVAAAVAAVVAPFAARLRGLYLAVVTLALIFIFEYLWNDWTWLTGGFNGRPAQDVMVLGHDLFEPLDLFGVLTLSSDQQFYFLCLSVLTVVAYGIRNVQRSRIGRAFLSVRERDLAAAVAGVPVTRTKVTSFVVAGFCAGLAGSLLAGYQSYVLPGQWNLALSIEYVAMIVIGGLGSLPGAIAGAFFVVALPTLVRSLTGVLPFLSDVPASSGGLTVPLVADLLYGVTIVVVLIAEPRGIWGLWERFKRVWRTWPWSR